MNYMTNHVFILSLGVYNLYSLLSLLQVCSPSKHYVSHEKVMNGPISFVDIVYQVSNCSHPHFEDCKYLLRHIQEMGVLQLVDVFLSLKSEIFQLRNPDSGGEVM